MSKPVQFKVKTFIFFHIVIVMNDLSYHAPYPKPISQILSYPLHGEMMNCMNPHFQNSFPPPAFPNRNLLMTNQKTLTPQCFPLYQPEDSIILQFQPFQIENQKCRDLGPSQINHQYKTPFELKSQRRKFSHEEDLKLSQEIAVYGPRKWNQIALALPGRTGRQCRDRFHNYLNPNLINGPWTNEEDILLEQKALELNQHWNKIAKYFVGRSANNIKNRWYTYISKKNRCQYKNQDHKNMDQEQKIDASVPLDHHCNKAPIENVLTPTAHPINENLYTKRFKVINPLPQNSQAGDVEEIHNGLMAKDPELIENSANQARKIIFPSIPIDSDNGSLWNHQKLFELLTNEKQRVEVSGPFSASVKS